MAALALTLSLQIEGMFALARDRNAAPISVSSAIAASFPSLVISHLGLNIPVVQRASWARSITTAAVAHAVHVSAARMPQVSCKCRTVSAFETRQLAI